MKSTEKEIITRGKIFIGKIARNNEGAKGCECFLEYELRQSRNGPVFSMSGEAWNQRKTDVFWCGQNCDELVKEVYSKGSPRNVLDKSHFDRMVEIWRLYHLNDMNAGTIEQSEALNNAVKDGNLELNPSYKESCEFLKSAGLYEVDLPDGSKHKYGYQWLYRPIPDAIIEEIKSWNS